MEMSCPEIDMSQAEDFKGQHFKKGEYRDFDEPYMNGALALEITRDFNSSLFYPQIPSNSNNNQFLNF